MNRVRAKTSGVTGLVLLAVTPFLFAATNPVAVESLDVDSNLRSNDVEAPFEAPIEELDAYSDSERKALTGGELQYQMQLLQQEVQSLRGLVEELTYEISRVRKTQEDRYLELDSRFQRLDGRKTATAPSSTIPQPSVSSTVRDERVLYDAALELIRSHQWELGIEQMQSVIDRFPDGKLTPNAYYWLGEAYTIKPEADYEKARKNLSQVITYFPDHDKRPHAEFKLGMVYHLMGDCVRAGDLLKQVVDQQQGKSVAKYAEDYLRKKVGNCE